MWSLIATVTLGLGCMACVNKHCLYINHAQHLCNNSFQPNTLTGYGFISFPFVSVCTMVCTMLKESCCSLQ